MTDFQNITRKACDLLAAGTNGFIVIAYHCEGDDVQISAYAKDDKDLMTDAVKQFMHHSPSYSSLFFEATSQYLNEKLKAIKNEHPDLYEKLKAIKNVTPESPSLN